MIENTNTKQFYPGPILNDTLEISEFLFNTAEQIKIKHSKLDENGVLRDVDLVYGQDYEVLKDEALTCDDGSEPPSHAHIMEMSLTASTGQITLKEHIHVIAGERLTAYRESAIIQDKNYPRTGAFPAATHEGALDYLTMQNQEQEEQLSRCIIAPITLGTFNGQLPTPAADQALKWNTEGTELENYDIIGAQEAFENDVNTRFAEQSTAFENRINQFEEETQQQLLQNKTEIENRVTQFENEVNTTIAQNKADTDKQIADFEQEVNTTIDEVREAAGKVNELEQAVEEAKVAAQTATTKADETQEVLVNAITEMDSKLTTANTAVENATQQANLATQKAQEILDINPANTNLSNLTEEGLKIIKDNSGSGLELCDIGMSLYVDETKGLRRYLNGQIVDINTNTQAFLNRLQQITTLHPSLLCTEEEWQTAKTLSAFGQVGKFVFNYSGDEIVSVRLPRVVNVQGLFDLQNLGMTVDESLPNITGTAQTAPGRAGYIANGALAVYATQNATNVYGTGPTGTSTQYGISFDASRSSSTYQDDAPVQQEAIQYPYFIQIATGAETENNIINEIELNNPYSLFDSKYSDHELNNLSWLKSEGQWNAEAVYPTAYDELLTEYNNSASVNKTEGSITFKRTPKGYKIALANQETAIDTKYSTDGIAWYYILDTTNKKFKLPRTKFGFEGLRTSVGDDIAESLPNIKGALKNTDQMNIGSVTASGAFTTTSGSTNKYCTEGTSVTTRPNGYNFNASRSSSTYKDGAPVQERATQMYLYFYVGETVQNANLIDAGRIGEQLGNKADLTMLANKADLTMPSIQAPYLKQTYVNGTSGYRIWSDGYCEQWGESASTTGNITISFLKTFANTNYYANVIQTKAKNGSVERITSRTTTSMVITLDTFSGSQPSNAKLWRACGYLASGQY